MVGVQLGSTVTEDLGRAELLAFPFLVLLSLLFFRGRAALIPLVVGVTTVLGTFLVLTGVNQVYGLSVFALNLVIGLGLGLAIDYTLFLVTRYREELAPRDRPGRRPTTMRTAGRTVAFSAATVAVALAALTVFPLGFIKSMGSPARRRGRRRRRGPGDLPRDVRPLGAKLGRKERPGARRRRPLVPPLARRDAPPRRGRDRHRRGHARPRGAGAARRVDPHRQLGHPDRQELADRRRHRRVGLRRHRRQPDDGRVSTAGDAGAAAVTAYADEVTSLPDVAYAGAPVQLDPTTWQLDVTAEGSRRARRHSGWSRTRGRLPSTGVDAMVAGPAAEFVDQQSAICSRLPLAGRPPRRADPAGAVADDRLGGAAGQGGHHERPDGRGAAWAC